MLRDILKIWVDFVFPPLCLHCGERSETKHLCSACWNLCIPPDPAERCRHCFAETEGGVCKRCRGVPALPFVRGIVFEAEAPVWRLRHEAWDAIAGFAYNQWVRLEWPDPDALVPMPDADSERFGQAFAKLMDKPLIRCLFPSDPEPRHDRIEEGLSLLLLDASNPEPRLQKACLALAETSPKRVHLLSLIP